MVVMRNSEMWKVARSPAIVVMRTLALSNALTAGAGFALAAFAALKGGAGAPVALDAALAVAAGLVALEFDDAFADALDAGVLLFPATAFAVGGAEFAVELDIAFDDDLPVEFEPEFAGAEAKTSMALGAEPNAETRARETVGATRLSRPTENSV